MRKNDNLGKSFENARNAAAYTHLGLTLAGSVLGLFFLGYWIDGMIGSEPWLAIAGAFLGMTGGFINLVRTLNQIREDGERSGREKSGRDLAPGGDTAVGRRSANNRSDGETGDQ